MNDTLKFPIDVTTAEGEAAIRYLLAGGYSTPKQICDVVYGVSLVEDCVVIDDAPWHCDDGNAEVEYPYDDYTAAEAAHQYVEDGDWGDALNGCIDVSVWRVGIDADGGDCRVEEYNFGIDLVRVLDHSAAIREVMGNAGCGHDPDDHEWTSEGGRRPAGKSWRLVRGWYIDGISFALSQMWTT